MDVSPPNRSFDPLATTSRSACLDTAIADLAAGWAEGKNPSAERFAGRIASDGPEALVELVYHEFCLAEAAGLAPQPESYFQRFPNHRESLGRMFELHRVFSDSVLQSCSIPDEKTLPVAGFEIGPYRLLRELGRGGLARVFLAEQSDLNDRLVVLKVSARPSLEAVLQARASHPHIVDVIRHDQTEDGSLHLIAMPFLGGATLAAVLAEDGKRFHRAGRGLLKTLDRVSAPECLSAERARSAVRDHLVKLPRAKVMAWMVARLAEALDHAAHLGVTHGDLKPANILIAADGRPLLFDFNLAIDWRSAEAEATGPTGGTLAYMAPERLKALAEPKCAVPPRSPDRQKADIYSLGLVFREMLTAEPPRTPEFSPSNLRLAAATLAESRESTGTTRWYLQNRIPAGLRPILARCLAPNPADRYVRMADLAQDLDLWGEDRPTLHARAQPRSGLWLSRHRVGVGIAAALVLVGCLAGWGTWSAMSARLRRQAEQKLALVWDAGDRSAFRGRRFGEWRLDDDATAEISRRNLDRYGVFDQQDWRQRDDVRFLDENNRIDLEMWLLEQAWRLASVWEKRPNAPDDWRRALSLLESSPEWSGIDAFVELRNSLRRSLGLSQATRASVQPPDWLEDYAVGLSYEGTDPNATKAAYARILVKRPDALWANYRTAAVASRLGQHSSAAERLTHCLDLRPNNSALLSQRGGCFFDAGQYQEALSSCTRAVDLDPDYRDAYLMRALVRIRLEQSREAQADIDRFVALSRAQPADVWQGREAYGKNVAQGRPVEAAAQAAIARALERNQKYEEAAIAYGKAIEYDTEDLNSRARRAEILRRLKRNEGMNEMASVIESPRFGELVRQDKYMLRLLHLMAVYRLRNGSAEEAQLIAERALNLARSLGPSDNQTSLLVAESSYTLAQTLAPKAAYDPQVAKQAAELLSQAGRTSRRFIKDMFLKDPLFDGSRERISNFLEH